MYAKTYLLGFFIANFILLLLYLRKGIQSSFLRIQFNNFNLTDIDEERLAYNSKHFLQMRWVNESIDDEVIFSKFHI